MQPGRERKEWLQLDVKFDVCCTVTTVGFSKWKCPYEFDVQEDDNDLHMCEGGSPGLCVKTQRSSKIAP